MAQGSAITQPPNPYLPPNPLTWIAFPFASGWVNYGAPFQVCEYSKDPHGIVRLRGLSNRTSGSGTGAIGTLPAGYRPPGTELHTVACVTSPGFIRVDTEPDGDVINTVAAGVNTWISLNGIMYQAI